MSETKKNPVTKKESTAVERIARKEIGIEILEDVDSGAGGARFYWTKDGEEQEYICSLSEVLGPKGAAFQELADACMGGFSNPKDLKQFVNDALDVAAPGGPVKLLRSTRRAGWRAIDGHQVFVANGWHLGNGAAPVLASRKSVRWETKGDAGQYFERMRSMLAENPALAFVSGFFAGGSIVKLVRAENFILSLVGRTSIGKTLAIKTALSMRGDPSQFPTFDATAGSLKAQLRQACDACLPIDEIGQAGLRPDEKQKLIYDICAGKERGRLKKSSTGDYEADISSLLNYTVIVTGEEALITSNAAGGATVRITEMVFDDADGKRLWTSLRGSAEAESWDTFMHEHHGWIMPLVIQQIAADPDDIKARYEMQLRLMREYAAGEGGQVDGATSRKLKTFALAITGAEIIDQVLEAGGAIVDGVADFALEQVAKGAATSTSSDHDRYSEFLHSIPARYNDRLFQINGDGSEDVRRAIGAASTGTRPELRIIAGELARICDHDHIDAKRFLEWAEQANVLQFISNGAGKRTFVKRLNVGPAKTSCYQFCWFSDVIEEGGAGQT